MNRNEFRDVNAKSPGSKEIIGFIPHWIVRTGISVVFVVTVILLAASWFIKYPDVIHTSITLTAENPPAKIIARRNGKLEALFVVDKQLVKKDELLGVIRNPANFHDIQKIKLNLEQFKNLSDKVPDLLSDSLDPYLTLGDVQPAYLSFLSDCNKLKTFIDIDYHNTLIKSANKEIKLHRSYFEQQKNQKLIMKKSLNLSRVDYERDSVLFAGGSISRAEYDKSLGNLLQQQYNFENIKKDLSREQIQLHKLEQNLLETKMSYREEYKYKQIQVYESLKSLLSMIDLWEHNYILTSPVDGKITFSDIWDINHNVTSGEEVMTVVPASGSKIKGRLKLPLRGAGKVKSGQSVKIKFDNYPSAEFGVVEGAISGVSLLPDNGYYIAEVTLPDGLRTSYQKILAFNPEMQGSAEIITDESSLIRRIMRPLKALIRNN